VEVKEIMKTYEKGKCSSEEFFETMQTTIGKNIKEEDFISAWNALLIGIPKTRISFLKNLRKEYKIALLSNTNQIHLEWVREHLLKEHGLTIEAFEKECFDHVFYSHDVKSRKPDLEIFLKVEKETGIEGMDILFIDDLFKNIVGARDAGWVAVHHRPETDIEVELESYIYYWNVMFEEGF
jgi:putative hydrolase of the HAD superfamily